MKQPTVQQRSAWLTCVLVLGLCVPSGAATQAAAHPTILVLYDGGREFSSIQITDRAIESTLNRGLSNRVTIFREYMDLTRLRPANYEQVLRDFYRAKYSGNRPDVIVAIRGRTLDFLLAHGDELFPGIPIVSSGMDLRQVRARTLPAKVTGHSLQVRYWPSLALAMALEPRTQEAVVVLGASPNDRALEALVRDELRAYDDRLKLTYLVGLRIDDLLERVAHLPPHTAILFVSFAQDGDGTAFLPTDAISRIAGTANAPTYIASDDVLDIGAVGGDLISFSALGEDTAKLVLRLLHGDKPASIPFTEASARVKTLDARQLQRWEIPWERVPPDTVVLHQGPTRWQSYGRWIVGGGVLLALQSGLIATLLLQRNRRRRAEENLRTSEAQGRAAVLEERNRMARDMHDTLAQGFTGVIVQLEAAQQAFAHGCAEDCHAHVQRASSLARESLGEARRSLRALRPGALQNAELCAALDGVMKQMTAGTEFRVEFATHGQPRPLVASTEENLLRIHQEIIANALKHSRATAIRAALSFDEKTVRLEVHDDGGGFDVSMTHDGLGLLGIRERVSQMCGELMIESHPGAGTRIGVVLPYA